MIKLLKIIGIGALGGIATVLLLGLSVKVDFTKAIALDILDFFHIRSNHDSPIKIRGGSIRFDTDLNHGGGAWSLKPYVLTNTVGKSVMLMSFHLFPSSTFDGNILAPTNWRITFTFRKPDNTQDPTKRLFVCTLRDANNQCIYDNQPPGTMVYFQSDDLQQGSGTFQTINNSVYYVLKTCGNASNTYNSSCNKIYDVTIEFGVNASHTGPLETHTKRCAGNGKCVIEFNLGVWSD